MITLQNQRIETSSSINIKKCAFVNLVAANGGAILSDYDAVHALSECSFTFCKAINDSESRGGAFFLKQGNITVRSCCSFRCSGAWCSDIDVHFPSYFSCSLLSSNGALGDFHALYCSSTSKLVPNDINVTNSYLTQSKTYGCGINFQSVNDFESKYVSIVDCDCVDGVICIDHCTSINPKLDKYIAVNNTNINYLITIRFTTSVCFEVSDSYFLKSSNFNIVNDINSITAKFVDCLFSISKPSLSVTLSNCSFDSTNEIRMKKMKSCLYIGKRCTIKTRRDGKTMNIVVFLIVSKE